MSGPDDDPMFFQAGAGTALVVTEIPGRQPPPYQMVSFMVTGIAAIVAELKRRGVEFQQPEASTFAGVAGVVDGHVIDYGPVKSAVFRDTEGNLLALNEVVAAPDPSQGP